MKKIIIVDRIRQQLETELYLEGGGVETVTVYSNEDALDRHRKHGADLIITELYGSGINAVQLGSIIREDRVLRKVSMIVFCKDNEIEITESLKSRANAVLTLPIKFSILLRAVHSLLMVPHRADYRGSFLARCSRLSGRSFIECSVENISVTGMLIQADAVLKKGDRITCSLTLPPAVSCETQAEVVRTVTIASDQHQYGIRFSRLAPAARRAIETLVQQRAALTS